MVERYQIDLVAAAQAARAEMEGKTQSLLRRRSPRMTPIVSSKLRATTAGKPSSTSSVPIWLLTYDYAADHYQVVINGYHWRHRGESIPKSWAKIALRGLGRAIRN